LSATPVNNRFADLRTSSVAYEAVTRKYLKLSTTSKVFAAPRPFNAWSPCHRGAHARRFSTLDFDFFELLDA
jgi:hypothetical protein